MINGGRAGVFGAVAALALLGPPVRVAAALDAARSLRQYTQTQWKTNDGLPDGEIHSILQTRDGYLWLGTQTGLARFDGIRFTVFDMSNTPVLPASNIASLTEDREGTLWIGLPGGLVRLRDGRFVRFDTEQGLLHPYVRTFLARPGGRALVSTGGSGIWEFDGARFSRPAGFDEGRWPGFVEHLADDAKTDTVWAATNGGALRLAGGQGRLMGVADGLPHAQVNRVFVDAAGTVWAGTLRGLARLEGPRFRVVPALAGDDVRAITEDRDGNLWVGTHGGGLFRLARRTAGETQRFDIGDDRVFSLAEDRDGSLWVGTGGGLYRLEDGPFVSYGAPEGLRSEDIFGVAAARDGSVVFVDSQGAARRLVGDQVETVLPPGTLAGGVPSLAIARDGSVYVSGRALYRLEGARATAFPLEGREITALAADGDGLLLAARNAGGAFEVLRFEAGRFSRQADRAPLPFVHVHTLRRDGRGAIWAATEGGGVHRFSPDGTHRVYGPAQGLPHETAYGLQVDDENRVWVTTRRGLACIQGESVTALSGADGLPAEALFAFEEDDAGSFWLLGDSGILRVARRDLREVLGRVRSAARATRFDTTDGLRSITLSWRGSGVSRAGDGRLWFATASGLVSVDPRRVSASPNAPRVYVEALTVDGRPFPLREPIVLPAGADRIEIEYTGLGLRHPSRTTFRHGLDGYVGGWTDAGRRRLATYTNLAPGAYRFRVRAANDDGVWSREDATLAFEVTPRWYQASWARGSALVAALVAVLTAHRLRVRRLRRLSAELQRRVDERTRALSDEVAERLRAEADLRRLAGELDERVRSRTAELETANRRLAVDVEERRRAERNLAAEKDRLAVTLQSIADGVIATDTDGRVILLNRVAEQLAGRSMEEAIGRPLAELLERPDRGPDPRAGIARQAVERGGPAEAPEAPLVDALGRERLVAMSAAPIHDDEGAVVGSVLVIRDVTERRRIEEELQRSARMGSLAVLAGGIAHDFNNLLTGVFGYLGLATKQLDRPERARASLRSAEAAIDKARALTGQLLTFTRAGEPTVAPFDLRPALEDSAGLALSGSNLRCAFELAEDLWPCLGDANQIAQVVDNLVLNARQAMPGGGTIVVRARNAPRAAEEAGTLPPGRYLRFDIVDRGAGISPSLRDRVFEPFFTTKSSGTGLGLATAYSIVQRHGGRIDFESVEGQGTTFSVWLPAAEEIRREAAASTADAGERHGRILVMDDEACVRDVLAEFLRTQGHEVDIAAHGAEAVALFRQGQLCGRPFDVAVLDLTIPAGEGGAQVLARLREVEPRVRAVASSGYSADPVMADPTGFGFTAALPKPYPLDDLAGLLQRLLTTDPDTHADAGVGGDRGRPPAAEETRGDTP